MQLADPQRQQQQHQRHTLLTYETYCRTLYKIFAPLRLGSCQGFFLKTQVLYRMVRGSPQTHCENKSCRRLNQ